MALNSDGDANFFSEIGLKYEQAFGHDPGLHDFIEASLNRLPVNGASILELGSGTGRPTAEKVIERGGFSLQGIDISPVMVEIARRQVPQAMFEQANMLEYEPELNRPGYDGIFTVFSIFHFSRDEMNTLTKRLGTWLKPGGFLFVGTMVADDFQTTPGMWDADGHCARGIPHTFMGRRKENLLYSKKGWEELLSSGGFKIVETKMVAFQAPPEAQCDLEPHYYIIAQRIE